MKRVCLGSLEYFLLLSLFFDINKKLTGKESLLEDKTKKFDCGDYKPFGELLLPATTIDWLPLKTFALHEYDSITNLYYAQNRWYDAETGSFISEDPIKDGNNYYSYCGGNPMGMVDPTGLYWGDSNAPDWNDYYDLSNSNSTIKQSHSGSNSGVNYIIDSFRQQLNSHGYDIDLPNADKIKNFSFSFGKDDEGNFSFSYNYDLIEAESIGDAYLITGFNGSDTFGLGKELDFNHDKVDTFKETPKIRLDRTKMYDSGAAAPTNDEQLVITAFSLIKNVVKLGAGFLLKNSGDDVLKAAGKTGGQGFKNFNALKRTLGPAGEGNSWHHIVEQSQIGKSGFSSEMINNTKNIVSINNTTHTQISAFYSRNMPGINISVRNWLAGQSFETQYQYGLDVLKQFGVIK